MFRSSNKISLLACFVALTFIAGCSSVGRTSVTTQTPVSIPHEATASLLVKYTAKNSNKYQVQIQQLLSKDLATGLVSAGIFRLVTRVANAADYKIDARIEGVRIISGGQRFWLGAFAARSHVKVHVDIRETNSSNIIASFLITGYGARSAIGAQSYGYDDPVREVVAQVIQNLR